MRPRMETSFDVHICGVEFCRVPNISLKNRTPRSDRTIYFETQNMMAAFRLSGFSPGTRKPDRQTAAKWQPKRIATLNGHFQNRAPYHNPFIPLRFGNDHSVRQMQNKFALIGSQSPGRNGATIRFHPETMPFGRWSNWWQQRHLYQCYREQMKATASNSANHRNTQHEIQLN